MMTKHLPTQVSGTQEHSGQWLKDSGRLSSDQVRGHSNPAPLLCHFQSVSPMRAGGILHNCVVMLNSRASWPESELFSFGCLSLGSLLPHESLTLHIFHRLQPGPLSVPQTDALSVCSIRSKPGSWSCYDWGLNTLSISQWGIKTLSQS